MPEVADQHAGEQRARHGPDADAAYFPTADPIAQPNREEDCDFRVLLEVSGEQSHRAQVEVTSRSTLRDQKLCFSPISTPSEFPPPPVPAPPTATAEGPVFSTCA